MKLNEQSVGTILIFLGLAGLVVSLWARPVDLQTPASEPTSARQVCRVLFVTDGDTVGCDLNGNGRYDKPVELIRFLGIDTPEMHYSKKNPTYGSEHPTDEPFAKEASALTQRLAEHRTLYLEYDRRRTDTRGRTLAHAYLLPEGGHPLAEELLSHGYAEVLFLQPNLRHYERFQKLEDEARAAGRGRWQP